ncbi:MAG: 3'-5' exonuclease [Alphaproteobacteria bacterium]|nr:3'-5' exonuclease [Alphaproteobacteria bacterium]
MSEPVPAAHVETRATYFCLDLEANGPVPGLYDMVSVGVVAVVPDDAGHLALGASLYLEIQPQAPRFSASAAAIHGLDQDRLKREGLPRRDAALQLAEWVRAQTRPGTEPVFVGHNAPFDWSFISWTYAAEDLDNPFGYKALCTKALSGGVLGLHWLDTNKEILSERLGLPAEDLGQKHRADYDAAYQARILLALLDHQARTAR